MDRFINRVLRPTTTPISGSFAIIVNGEQVGTVIPGDDRNPWVAMNGREDMRSEHVPYITPVTGSTAKEAAGSFCHRAENVIQDVFFEVEANPEPDDPSNLYYVQMAARGSGRVIESFTAQDPYGYVGAFRESQSTSLEERLGEFGTEWEREQEDRRLNR